MPHPLRSRDHLEDDHMIAEVHRRLRELVPLLAVRGQSSYFNFDERKLREAIKIKIGTGTRRTSSPSLR